MEQENDQMPFAMSAARALCAALPMALVLAATTARAQEYDPNAWYGGATGAAVFADDYDTGWGLNGFAGYDFGNGFRGEGELGWQIHDFDAGSGDSDLWYGMASGYYDFAIDQPFTPYIGAGLGYGWLDLDGTPAGFAGISDDDDVWLYHLTAGVSYALSAQTTIFGAYRWMSTFDEPSFTDAAGRTFEQDYDASIIQAGVRFAF